MSDVHASIKALHQKFLLILHAYTELFFLIVHPFHQWSLFN